MAGMPNPDFWAGRSVFVTGHMGFKGAWLTRLLYRLGARTVGYGRDDRTRLLYRSLDMPEHRHIEGDINDGPRLTEALKDSDAEVLIHLAAQPIVLSSYDDPLETFLSNTMGTASVLQCARAQPKLKAIIVVTSDKVYHNNEWQWPYRESDRLGGADPYSASKAAAEIVAASMVTSFYNKPESARVASARAGNVIGGGDWAEYRLLPDAARAFEAGQPLLVRNPNSTRPWQHVLEPLGGYLVLAERLAGCDTQAADAWNFGPVADDAIPVQDVADTFVSAWGHGAKWELEHVQGERRKEANFLAVDASKARIELCWTPQWRVHEAISRTAVWYRDFLGGAPATSLVDRDITDYFHLHSPTGS